MDMTNQERAPHSLAWRWPLLLAVALAFALGAQPAASAGLAASVKAQKARASVQVDRVCATRFASTATRQACRDAILSTRRRGTKAVIPGFIQYAYVCHRGGGFIPSWSGVALTATTFPQHMGAANHTRDFVIYPQVPEGLQPGTTVFTATVNAACTAAALSAFGITLNATPAPIRPAAPTFNEACGTAADLYTVPPPTIGIPATGTPQTIGVVYFVTSTPSTTPTAPNDYAGTGTVTIQARTYGVFRFANGATTSWTFTFSATPCPRPVIPETPTATGVCGPENDTMNLPTVTGVTYTVGPWQNNVRTVTASADEGFVIPTGTRRSWTFTDQNVPCPIVVTTTAPTVAPACGPANDVVTLPDIVGITYTIGDWVDGTRVVSAVTQPGYVFGPGSAVSWRVTDGAVPCVVVEPPAPQATLTIRKFVRTIGPTSRPARFTILVRNTSAARARNVMITDRIPSGLALAVNPVDAAIVKGVITWQIGDLEPGAFIYVSATMRPSSNRTVRRCNAAAASAENAPAVGASVCTRFTKVLGAARAAVTG